ncbi:unnamed protein product [Clonostachys rhizophaga]|uniref:SMP-30/Gluconolactonase/LRE-like region domain-containing protein n=1 Tax=Clonostachys rhizophaga TaxID=160324 RepID=A0A9N9VUT5_9HYPO|nr:unnamed protein product [Clonostachys rhizophaga]
MRTYILSTLCLAASISCLHSPSKKVLGVSSPTAPSIIHDFGPGYWLENLYIRSNGQILTTSQSSPELYLIDTYTSERTLVHTFPNRSPGLTGLGGIVETSQDTFAIILGDLNHTTLAGVEGSFSIWTINLTGYPDQEPIVKEIASLPDSAFLNGLTTLEDRTTVLACDSFYGSIYRIDTLTGEVELALASDNTTLSPPGQQWVIGIDGIKIYRPHGSEVAYLYYTNYMGQGYYRVPIDPYVGTPAGPAEVLGTGLGIGLDDININRSGTSWISVSHESKIIKVESTGGVHVAAESPDLRFVTAVRQGRTRDNYTKLYFSTGLGKVGFIDVSRSL